MTEETGKANKKWNERSDEIEELKKIFYQFLKRWINDDKQDHPNKPPNYYVRLEEESEFKLAKHVRREKEREEQLRKQRMEEEKLLIAQEEERQKQRVLLASLESDDTNFIKSNTVNERNFFNQIKLDKVRKSKKSRVESNPKKQASQEFLI